MKKFLVLALAVVLTLSLTVVASAATFDPYVGGRLNWVYDGDDAKDDTPTGHPLSGIKMLLKGKVSDEETGTWGAIGTKIDGWPKGDGQPLGNNAIYEFGVDGIAGSNFNLWYSNFENEKGNRGQNKLLGIDPRQSHDDCIFDRDLQNHVIGIDYVSDKVVVNIGYEPNKDTDADGNISSIAVTFKFDGGEFYVGNYDGKIDILGNNNPVKASESAIGGSFKLGFGTIKADYLALSPDQGDDGSVFQLSASIDPLKLEATVAVDDKYVFRTDGGIAYQIKYRPLDKLTLCYRAAEAEDKVDDVKNYTNYYVGYNYGVIEARLGGYTKAADTLKEEEGVYASCYVSFW